MKYRVAAFLIIVATILLVWQAITWHAVHAQPASAVIPFADGISIQGFSGAGVTLFARQANGTYISLLFGVGQPYSLQSSISGLTQLLSGGLKNLAAAPAGPAGVGRQSQVVAFADLDGNGSVGAAFGGGGVVTVYQGTTGLSFHMLVNYPIGQDVNSVFFADFNGDGLPDLAVAYDGGNTPGGIAILLNKGDGTFGSPITYASGTKATNFAVLDLNHDGILDIATVSLDQKVTILLGKGDGAFGSPTQYVVGTGPGPDGGSSPSGGSGQAITIADFNGDGNPDIAVGGATGILLGHGDGTFQPGPALPAVASGTLIWAFAAGDLNGDGKIDLVYADVQNQVVVPLFGKGDGTFQPGQAYSVSALPVSLILADYNNDGHLDIINGNGDARFLLSSITSPSDNADILLNNGDGTFQGAPNYFTLPNSEANSNFYQVSGMATGNFGGTYPGFLASSTGALTLFLGNGKGGFQAPQSVTTPGSIYGPIVAADFNGDGIADAAVVQQNAGSGTIFLLPGTATGFGSPTPITTSGPIPAAMVSGDFNGDGHADLVFVSQANGSGVLGVLKGNGNGTFQTLVTSPAGVSPFALSAVDLNGDGKLDLVFADSGTNGTGGGIYVVMNAGGDVFQAPVMVLPGSYQAFGVGDVNGDGKPDLVVSSGQAVISWLAGNGNGTFQTPIAISTSNAPVNAVLVEDFTGSGDADIVLAHQASNTTYLASYGGGTFSAETPFLGPGEPTLLTTADFNGDGKPDLLVGGLTISVLLNKSVTTAKASVSSSAPAISTAIAPGSLASAYGTDLANKAAGGTSLPLPTSFGGTSISIQDASGNVTAAPLLYVIPAQVNFEVPPGLATGPATVTITSGDGTQSAASVQVASVAPGIFELNSGGLAAAYVTLYHADGSTTVEQVYTVNSAGAVVATPVSLGSSTDQAYLFIFGTGLQEAGTAGVTVSLGGVNVPVSYAGAQGGFVGLDQVNVQLPASLRGKGNVTIQVTAGGIAANAVSVTIQ